MKRILVTGLSTVSAVVLLFSYHTSTASTLAQTPTSVYSGTVAGAASTTTPGATTAGAGAGAGSSASSASTTYVGSVVQTRYGPVQVQLTVGGAGITGVDVLQYPNHDSRDAQINGYALPVLIQETLDAQSSSIDMVSGATYTSTGYQQSLQSALDQAGL